MLSPDLKQRSRSRSEILRVLTEEYLEKHRQAHIDDIKSYFDPSSDRTTLYLAATARNNKGAKHPHQRRISNAALEAGAAVLLSHLDDLLFCSSFDQLHSRIRSFVESIKGLGQLFVYDTALRFGFSRNLNPTLVYLHRGTRTGAARLGLNSKKATLNIYELPKEMSELSPIDVEDFLCIYKNEL